MHNSRRAGTGINCTPKPSRCILRKASQADILGEVPPIHDGRNELPPQASDRDEGITKACQTE